MAKRAQKSWMKTIGIHGGILGVIVAIVVVLAGMYSFGFFNHYANEQVTVWVDDDEPCVDHIKQAKDKLGMNSGSGVGIGIGGVGDNQIPEPYGDVYTITGYTEYGIQYFDETTRQPTSQKHWDSTSPEAVVHDKWVQAGAKYDDGVAVLDNKYLVATTPKFGNIGDHVTFYLSNGKSLECILADVKGSDANSEWGHDGGRSVLEFEVEPAKYTQYGNPGNGYMNVVKGTRTTSWTNHGQAVDVASGLSGSAGGASNAAANSQRGVAASAMNDCQIKPKMDNSSLVSALTSLSYSQRKMQPYDDKGTAIYDEVCEAIFGMDDETSDYRWKSCDRGVCVAIHWTGADLNFPPNCCSETGISYCNESPLWEPVAGAQGVPCEGGDGWAEAIGLEPGDVGITNNHILAYVGHEAAEEGYEKFIKGNADTGPGTGGDMGPVDEDACFVSASAKERADNISNVTDSRIYYFFRYKGDYPDADKYADLGDRAALSGTSSRGTPCECEECEEAKNNVGSAEKFAEIAHKEATEGSSIAPKSYREATLEVAKQTSKAPNDYPSEFSVDPGFTIPDDPFNGWGGGCSAFVYWCCLEAGMEPGEHLPTGAKLVTFSAEDALVRSHPDIGTIHVMRDGSEAGYIPQVGDVAYLNGGCHFEIVTEVNEAAGTYKTATDGAETERQLDLSGSARGHSSYDIFLTFNWGNMQTKSSSTKKSNKEECDCADDWKDVKSDSSAASSGDEEAQRYANAKKLWQVFKAKGLADEKIAGMLGNFDGECMIDPTGIEGINDTFTMEGEKAQYKGTDNATRDAFNALFHSGRIVGVASAYQADDGRAYPGIGIESWTGPQVPVLLDKAQALGKDWYDLDFQLAYVLAAPDHEKTGDEFWKWFNAEGGSTARECANWFQGHGEFQDGRNAPAAYCEKAEYWFNEMKTWNEDPSYANSVLSMSSKLSEFATAFGMSEAAEKCESMPKMTEGRMGIIEAAKSQDGIGYTLTCADIHPFIGNNPEYQKVVDGGLGARVSAAGKNLTPQMDISTAETDCMGFTFYAYTAAGYTDYPVYAWGDGDTVEGWVDRTKRSRLDMAHIDEWIPGDVVFYNGGGGGYTHIAIYYGKDDNGNPQIIHNYGTGSPHITELWPGGSNGVQSFTGAGFPYDE